jgi:hypothetical protein
MRLRVAPAPASSGRADGEFSGCPSSSLPRLRLPADLRVTPNLVPSGSPPLRLRVSPNPASTSGSMMTPRLDSNFASSARAADESSFPAGSCTFLPNSGCVLNLNSAFHCRQADYESPTLTNFRIFLSGRNCVSNSLQGHQLERRLGRFNLWKQVQKEESSVDITSSGALIDIVLNDSTLSKKNSGICLQSRVK